jgi:hypothetical protein
MNTWGLYIGEGVRRLQSSSSFHTQSPRDGVVSRNVMVRTVGTGWRGESVRVGVASHSESASADCAEVLQRDVGGDAVGVTSVLPVVTSGYDVRL